MVFLEGIQHFEDSLALLPARCRRRGTLFFVKQSLQGFRDHLFRCAAVAGLDFTSDDFFLLGCEMDVYCHGIQLENLIVFYQTGVFGD